MFTTPLEIRLIGDQEFELIAPLVYENNTFVITLYCGLKSDGASIPRTLWGVVGCPFGGSYSRSAFLHDALYRSRLFDKHTCDGLFLEAMRSESVDAISSSLLYNAVVEFGNSSYANTSNMINYRDLVQIKIKE